MNVNYRLCTAYLAMPSFYSRLTFILQGTDLTTRQSVNCSMAHSSFIELIQMLMCIGNRLLKNGHPQRGLLSDWFGRSMFTRLHIIHPPTYPITLQTTFQLKETPETSGTKSLWGHAT